MDTSKLIYFKAQQKLKQFDCTLVLNISFEIITKCNF